MSKSWQKPYGESLGDTLKAVFQTGVGSVPSLAIRDDWKDALVERATELDEIIDAAVAALLAVEWSGEDEGHYAHCPLCGVIYVSGRTKHVKCTIDAALTKAGLADQAFRDAVRKKLGI